MPQVALPPCSALLILGDRCGEMRSPMVDGLRPRRQWRKVLYEQQGEYGDSHTGERFLQELVVNANLPMRRYAAVVRAALPVSHQLSSVVALTTASCHLYQGSITARQLLACDGALALAGILLALLCLRGSGSLTRAARATRFSRHGGAPARASAAAVVVATALLSPLLHTLTASISTDSVVAITGGLLIAHLYLSDGAAGGGGVGETLGGSISLACGICASMLIASRLHTPTDVFAQMVLSVEVHILGPHLAGTVAGAGPAALPLFVALLASATALLLVAHSILAASAFVCVTLFVVFICPLWLVRIHKYKAQINGPWDEAMPSLGRRS